MIAALVLLLVILALLVGVTVKTAVWLMWVGIFLALVWAIGWIIDTGETANRRRWYYW